MIDREAIKQRIEEIFRRRSLLEDYAGETFEEFTQNVEHYEAALRHLQVAIQACLDIAKHIIAARSFERPKELKEVFSVLAEKKVISQDLARRLAKATGVRNILVHSYLDVAAGEIYKHIQSDLSDLEEFIEKINEYVDLKEVSKPQSASPVER